MTAMLAEDHHGLLAEPATLTIVRVLPGPIERVWSYLTDGELRRQWLGERDGGKGRRAGHPGLGATTS